jgi:hypothetical protein
MANPSTRVYVTTDMDPSQFSYFTLDDPVQGLLDGDPAYGLAGPSLYDVSQFLVSVSINRGKSRELDRFTAGQASITFNNDNRWFDPFYVESPYYEKIVPRKLVVIETNGIRQFTGYIDDIDFTYQLGTKSFAIIKCVDPFLQLSSTQLSEFTTTAQYSGERVTAILNRPEVNWPLTDRDLDTGAQLFGDDTIPENTNALQYLQTIESSEPGAVFIAKNGYVTFKDRINVPPLVDTIIFALDGRAEAVPFSEVEVIYGSELLYNRIIITRVDGTNPQVAEDSESQTAYGIQTLSQDGLLIADDSAALSLAEYLIGLYAEPELRFSLVGVTLQDKSTSDQNEVLDLEINDIVKIVYTPNNVGAPIIQNALITGIKHDIGISYHKVAFEFGRATSIPFLLDDAEYGRLSGTLPTYDDSTIDYDLSDIKYDGTYYEFSKLAF